MKEVGSPAAGKTRTLNSALPPIDRTQISRIGDIEVPHRRPAAQDEAIEISPRHLLAHQRPAPIALGERWCRIFHELAHVPWFSSVPVGGLAIVARMERR